MKTLTEGIIAEEQADTQWHDDPTLALPEEVGQRHLATGCLPEPLLHLKIRLTLRRWPEGKVEHIQARLGETLLEMMRSGVQELKEPVLPPPPAMPSDFLRGQRHHEWSEPIQHLSTPLWVALSTGFSRHFAIEYRLAVQINARWGVAERSEMTPRELLTQFGFQPNEYTLYKADNKDPLPPDSPLHLKRGEKFEGQKDGRYGSSSVLSPVGRELEALAPDGLHAVVRDHNGQCYVEVSNVTVPTPPWSKDNVAILIAVPAAYPMGGLDAFYVEAGLAHAAGTVPYQQGVSAIAGKEWRLISWHYTLNRPWNAKSDDLRSHIEHCRGFFLTRGVGQ